MSFDSKSFLKMMNTELINNFDDIQMIVSTEETQDKVRCSFGHFCLKMLGLISEIKKIPVQNL